MQVKDVMTADPACCISESALQDVAQMMVVHDCGEIPVVENKRQKCRSVSLLIAISCAAPLREDLIRLI